MSVTLSLERGKQRIPGRGKPQSPEELERRKPKEHQEVFRKVHSGRACCREKVGTADLLADVPRM